MNGGTNGYGTYEIPKENNLKSYYIKNDNYTDDSFKKSGKVIAPMEGTTGNERFYVMALEDINSGTYYCWYDAAYGNLDSSYNVSGTDNDFAIAGANDFAIAGAEPTGRINTERMIASWNAEEYGVQNDNSTYDDMWGVIQDEVDDGWFVPSKSEWSAFGSAFGITRSNYSSKYGLSTNYWSSSQYNTSRAYRAIFSNGNINYSSVSNYSYVRLATTF